MTVAVAAHLDRIHVKGLAPPRPSTVSQADSSFCPSGSSVTAQTNRNDPHLNFSNSLVSGMDFSLGSEFLPTQDATMSGPDDLNQEFAFVSLADHIQSARHYRIRPSLSDGSAEIGARLHCRSAACSSCKAGMAFFNRYQDLEKHIQAVHLPCWIFCPHPGCTWRGSRMDDFKKHLETQKCGSKPERLQCQIYDVKMITGLMKNQVCAGVAQEIAVGLVKERALELGREEWLMDPWGNPPETQARPLRANHCGADDKQRLSA